MFGPLKRAPALGMGLLVVAGILGASGRLAWAVFCGLAGLTLVVLGGGRLIWLFVGAALMFCVSHRYAAIQSQMQLAEESVGDLLEMEVVMEGEKLGFYEIAEIQKVRDYADGQWVSVEDLKGTRIAVDNLPEGRLPGDRFRFYGKIVQPKTPRNFGEVDRGERFDLSGVVGICEWNEMSPIGEWDKRRALRRWSEESRKWVGAVLEEGIEDREREVAALRGMILGEKEQGADFEAFRLSGTLHVFAVSGLHVGLVGAIVWWILRTVGVLRKPALIGVLLAMVAYAFVTGFRPPALRAVVMGAVVIVGFLNYREANLLNSLGVSLILVLLWDPFQLWMVGLQLSYGVLFSIALFGGVVARLCSKWVEADDFIPKTLLTDGQRFWVRVKRTVATSFSVSAAAWLGSFPLMLMIFRLVTPIGVLATVCLMPLVVGILFLGILSLAGSIVGFSAPVNKVNASLAWGACEMAAFFEGVPGGHFRPNMKALRDDEVVVFEVEYGGACSYAAGGKLLVDGGSVSSWNETLFWCFQNLSIKPQKVVVTHADGTHCGGLVAMMRKQELGPLVLPVEEARGSRFRELKTFLNDTGHPFSFAKEGMPFLLEEGVTLEVLRVSHKDERSYADDQSVVIRYSQNGWRILFVGDLGMRAEWDLVRRGVDMEADILVMGRHLGSHSGTDDFLKAVSPRVIIASEDVVKEGEKVPKSWAQYVESLGIQLYKQSEYGGIKLRLTPEELVVSPFLKREGGVILRAP